VMEERIEYGDVRELTRGYGGNALRIEWETGLLFASRYQYDVFTIHRVVDEIIETIACCARDHENSELEVKDDAVTWVQLMKCINDEYDETMLDAMDRVLIYNYAFMREVTGLTSVKQKDECDWYHVAVVMTGTAKIPLPDKPSTFTYTVKTPISLKGIHIIHENLRNWNQEEDLIVHQSYPGKWGIKGGWGVDPLFFETPDGNPGDAKFDFPDVEMAILAVHVSDRIFEFRFGSKSTLWQYLRAIQWFSEGGIQAFAPVVKEADDGKKKKKK